jgi:hypothetical protein
VDAEDRLRISGETGDGGVLVLWMTQRMVNRLIGALAQWLEKQSGDVLPVEVAQGVAMKTAMSSLPGKGSLLGARLHASLHARSFPGPFGSGL